MNNNFYIFSAEEHWVDNAVTRMTDADLQEVGRMVTAGMCAMGVEEASSRAARYGAEALSQLEAGLRGDVHAPDPRPTIARVMTLSALCKRPTSPGRRDEDDEPPTKRLRTA